MRLPELAGTESNVSVINSFLGLNKNKMIAENEFCEMRNMTNDSYPLLSPREKRSVIRTIHGNFNGMANNFQNLVWTEGTKLYVNSSFVCNVSDSKKQYAMMGSYLVVFPDKIVWNMAENRLEQIEQSYSNEGFFFSICKSDGSLYTNGSVYSQATDPRASHPDCHYWIDTSNTQSVVMKIWDDSTSSWNSVGTTYVRFEAPYIGKYFKEGDGVRFSGFPTNIGANGYDFNTTAVIQARDHDWICVVGLVNDVSGVVAGNSYTLSRECPDLDFICEHNNRIWGCNSAKHEIYGCKLGDPTNWNCYAGLSTDSYAATIGTEGDFTGAVSYMGTVYFFKEKGVHRLQGSTPSSFQLSYLACRGVQKDSAGSLVILNEYLYYKARDGYVYFDGSFPRDISEALGTAPLYEAVSGAYRNKYYTCARDYNGDWNEFVFDTEKGTWVQEGADRIEGYGYMDGAMFFVIGNKMMAMSADPLYDVLLPGAPVFHDVITTELTFTVPHNEPDPSSVPYTHINYDLFFDNTEWTWKATLSGSVPSQTCRAEYRDSACAWYIYRQSGTVFISKDYEYLNFYPTTVELDPETGQYVRTSNGISQTIAYNPLTSRWEFSRQSASGKWLVTGDYAWVEADSPETEDGLWPSRTLYPGSDFQSDMMESDFDWYCITGDIGLDNPYNKYIGKLTMRISIENGARLDVDVMYDSTNVWEPLTVITTTKKRSYTIPMRVKRCDHMKLKIYGRGDVKIYSIAKVTETGSEVC